MMEALGDHLLSIIGLIVGAVAAYYGSMNAIRENLARHDERIKSAEVDAREAKDRAQAAHDRIDRMLAK